MHRWLDENASPHPSPRLPTPDSQGRVVPPHLPASQGQWAPPLHTYVTLVLFLDFTHEVY